MKLITRHTRAPRSGAFIRCPYCQGVSLVRHFAWTTLTCDQCGEMVAKDRWTYCDRSEVSAPDILRLGSPVTLRDGDEWCMWIPDRDRVISMYGTGGSRSTMRNRVEGRIQVTPEVALRQVQTHLEYGWKLDARGRKDIE
jgi:ribosomal protein S27E